MEAFQGFCPIRIITNLWTHVRECDHIIEVLAAFLGVTRRRVRQI